MNRYRSSLKPLSPRRLDTRIRAHPLLKFGSDGANLVPESLDLIRELQGAVCPVIFIGDGRGGKSYLASCLLGREGVFAADDHAEPKTEGVDMVIVSVSEVLAEAGLPIPQPEQEPEHFLILDCEGGNNALAAVRSLVDVVGVIFGAEVVFVASALASECALQSLGAALAARSLIRIEDDCGVRHNQLPNQRLIFVVNKNTLRYDDSTLEKILDLPQQDEGRQELRDSVRMAFSQRHFVTVPLAGSSGFEEKLQELRLRLIQNRQPLIFGGTEVRGPQLCGLLELVVSELHKTKEISLPSMNRYVVYNGYLMPIAEEILSEAELGIPRLIDYQPDIERRDPRTNALRRFDGEVAHVPQKALVEEVRADLEARLENLWDEVTRLNHAIGDEVHSMQTEMREVELERMESSIGVGGLLKRVSLTQKTMGVESRAVVSRKRGGEPECSAWTSTGTTVTRIDETAFELMTELPELRGRLNKCSPSIIRTILTVVNRNKQERICILKDGHFLWWDPDAFATKQEASGCINFLHHHAEVVAGSSDTVFTIRPVDLTAGWSDTLSFTGGPFRQFHFDAFVAPDTSTGEGEKERSIGRDEWLEAIAQHIHFGYLAFQQLGEDTLAKVKVHKPRLAQVEG